ncbi:MAG: SDR family NAD(P)-dependent oxidoreductase [Myxococcales bacterium]|nr:SDR family NAD(P)-dependent oxidoreductase [Myxococcales bacterium]
MSDRVALVTGTSSGFGLLAVVALAREGFRVIPTMRNLTKAERLRAAAAEAGVALEEIPALDVTDAASIAGAAERVRGEYGRLDVLVNNAGYALVGPMEDIPADAFRRQIETNVVGVAEVTKAFLPMMRAQGGGRIVNVASMAGHVGVPMMAPYNASKFALEGLTEAWAYELRPFGIDVVLIEPGTFKTDFDNRSMDVREDAASPYAAMMATHARKKAQIVRLGGDPARVARLIARAATTPRPRLRYAIGWDARLGLASRALLPDRFFRWAAARAAGVPRRL